VVHVIAAGGLPCAVCPTGCGGRAGTRTRVGALRLSWWLWDLSSVPFAGYGRVGAKQVEEHISAGHAQRPGVTIGAVGVRDGVDPVVGRLSLTRRQIPPTQIDGPVWGRPQLQPPLLLRLLFALGDLLGGDLRDDLDDTGPQLSRSEPLDTVQRPFLY